MNIITNVQESIRVFISWYQMNALNIIYHKSRQGFDKGSFYAFYKKLHIETYSERVTAPINNG